MEGVPLLPIANSIQYPGGTKAGSVTLRLPSACTEKEGSIGPAVILKPCVVEPNGIKASVLRMFAGLSTRTVNVWPGLRSSGACWMTGRTAAALGIRMITLRLVGTGIIRIQDAVLVAITHRAAALGRHLGCG